MAGNAPLHLILVGAGHGHLKTIHAIPELRRHGVRVTVIDPSPVLYYSGALAGVVSGRFPELTARIDTADIVRSMGGDFIEAVVERIDPAKGELTMVDGSTLRWDIASMAVGSRSKLSVPIDDTARSKVLRLKPTYDPSLVRSAIVSGAEGVDRTAAFRIVVVGGGATAVEIAANLDEQISRGALSPEHSGPTPVVELITRGERLLPQFPRRAGEVAEKFLSRRRVQVVLGRSLTAISAEALHFDGGLSRPYGIVLPAFGLEVPPLIRNSPVPTGKDGGLAVDGTLRVPGTDLFGVGDCIDFGPQPLEKVGVHAVMQSGVLLENIRRTVSNMRSRRKEAQELEQYHPPSKFLQIVTLGGRNAIACRGNRVWSGRCFNSLKERIDWQYVRSGGTSIRPAIFQSDRKSTTE